ncbi:MAG TPA: serine protease [Thermoanaerobaculia bacterium]|nr:serine protease [Thermoanaerobaculia bacterium]
MIGGRVATIAEFPWLAYIAVKGQDGAFACTGAVVAPRVVLTAGHCIEKERELAAYSPSRFRVITGTADVGRATAANLSTVSRAVFYPTFETARVQIDAGLLILSAPVAAPPLAIADRADAALLRPGTPISIAGWGVTGARAKAGPAVMRSGEMALRSQAACRRETRVFDSFYSTRGQLCARDTRRGAVSGCFGDSGGPAIARRADGTPVAIGIVAAGEPNCGPRLPTIYTDAAKISGWLSGWIATAERGAPDPPVPTASPPRLGFEHARELGAVALRKLVGNRFRQGVERRVRCTRRGWASVKCRASWRNGARRYDGSFTISLEAEGYAIAVRESVRVSARAA